MRLGVVIRTYANVESTHKEWEAKPSSPESIRLISMGKMLNDKTRLAGKGAHILQEKGIRSHSMKMPVSKTEPHHTLFI